MVRMMKVKRTSQRVDPYIIRLYNATIQNNREIDSVNKNELYIATVSIKLFLLTI